MKKKLNLSDVTLLAATSVEIDETQIALKISSQNIKFGAIKLLSPSKPKKKYPEIEYISIPSMDFLGYSQLIIEDLHKYFSTTHCLIVQSDSFVVDSRLWQNSFLQFDYIGAPWSEEVRINSELVLNMKENCVGNGGFSLRSHKLATTTSKIDFKSLKFPIKSEDIVICHYLYEKLIEKDILFAPAKIAAQFSMENIDNLYGQNKNSVFGFHARHMRDYFLKEYMRPYS